MNERTVLVSSPKAKLYLEADLAIRDDLQRFPKALSAYEALTADPEARGHWDMANYITMRKLGYNDHGRVHALLTGAASVAILELIMGAQAAKPDVMESGVGDLDDVFLVVLISTMLHDIGNQVHRAQHEAFGVSLAMPILDRILERTYRDPEQRTELRAFMLHSIFTHDLMAPPLTIEAGITAVADGTDITKGRGRKAFALGSVDIHSISALAVDEMHIMKGDRTPVEIQVYMNDAAGLFQVEETLARKVWNSPIKDLVSIVAMTREDSGNRIVKRVRSHKSEPRFILDD